MLTKNKEAGKMSKIWVLTWKRQKSNEDGELNEKNVKKGCLLYTDFASASADFRDKVREFVTAGNSTMLRNFHKGMRDSFFEWDENDNAIDRSEDMFSLVKKVMLFDPSLTRKNFPANIDQYDGMMSLKTKKGKVPCVEMLGIEEGPCNGYEPLLLTNAVFMENQDIDYYCYVRDLFDCKYTDVKVDLFCREM